MKFLFAPINIILAGLFFVFAWFQRNDIDPEIYSSPSFDNPTLDSVLWFLFYAVIGFAFLFLIKKRLPIWYFIIAIIACLAEMYLSGPGLWENLFGEKAFTMTGESMSGTDPRVELTREFFGAVIALAAVLFQWWQNKRLKPKAKA
ncbi:transmembrane 220 family protein [bacterium]|nr:transmembrane 220 family protein [bacterium]